MTGSSHSLHSSGLLLSFHPLPSYLEMMSSVANCLADCAVLLIVWSILLFRAFNVAPENSGSFFALGRSLKSLKKCERQGKAPTATAEQAVAMLCYW